MNLFLVAEQEKEKVKERRAEKHAKNATSHETEIICHWLVERLSTRVTTFNISLSQGSGPYLRA